MFTTIGSRPSRNSGKRFAGELDRREEIRLHDRPQAGGVGVGEAAVGADAGVVHQDVEAAEFLAGGVQRLPANCGIGHVADDRFGAATETNDLLDDRRKFFVAAGDEYLIDARAGQFEGDCPADASRRAGHDCAFVLESSACHERMLSYVFDLL